MRTRLDQASLLDALPLLLSLAGYALWKLGGRLMKTADDNLADFEDDEYCCDEYPEVPL